jgi:nitrogen fixation protein FixH
VLQQLGWKVEPAIGERSTSGTRPVTIAIRDADQAPQAGLRVTAMIYHHARGSQVEQLVLTETADGVYEAASRIDRDGLWEVAVQIEGEHGVATESYELTAK